MKKISPTKHHSCMFCAYALVAVVYISFIHLNAKYAVWLELRNIISVFCAWNWQRWWNVCVFRAFLKNGRRENASKIAQDENGMVHVRKNFNCVNYTVWKNRNETTTTNAQRSSIVHWLMNDASAKTLREEWTQRKQRWWWRNFIPFIGCKWIWCAD